MCCVVFFLVLFKRCVVLFFLCYFYFFYREMTPLSKSAPLSLSLSLSLLSLSISLSNVKTRYKKNKPVPLSEQILSLEVNIPLNGDISSVDARSRNRHINIRSPSRILPLHINRLIGFNRSSQGVVVPEVPLPSDGDLTGTETEGRRHLVLIVDLLSDGEGLLVLVRVHGDLSSVGDLLGYLDALSGAVGLKGNSCVSSIPSNGGVNIPR
mmetsp:Transcript_22133/g.41609  ORF Transcript_22133/g.41609 Transcript_22133/m.41609 type:complete len:210 (-) Transcript_22133:495-1124(-)